MGEPAIEGEVVDEAAAESARDLPAVIEHEAIIARGEISVDEMVAQKQKIADLMNRVMDEGKHYGKIPGVNKPTLLKPGAEAINVALRLAPDYESEKVWGPGDHLTVISKCVLRHIPTGLVIASGEGMCSTRESKYGKRKAMRLCPACGEPQIRRSKYAPKAGQDDYVEGSTEPGWYCWKKEGGCGQNFTYDDERIVGQEEGVIENPDLPDTWNTVLKMSDKRALVAATLNGTAASDVFTQDAEDGGVKSDSARPQGEPRRVDREPTPLPKNWAEIEAYVRACDNPDEAWALFRAFRRACSHYLFGVLADDPTEDAGLLDSKQWGTMGQKCQGASVWLVDNAQAEGPFTFHDESLTRQAFAHVLGGHTLEIPDYEPPQKPEQDEAAADARSDAERQMDDAAAEAALAPDVPKD